MRFACASLLLSMALSPVVLAAERPSGGDQSQRPAVRKAALAGDLKALQQRQSNARSAASTLRVLAGEAMPAGLPQADQATWETYAEFLGASSQRIEELVTRWEAKLVALDEQIESARSQRAVRAAARQLDEVNRSFNMQYLGLQQEMQAENRKFTVLSNIMKTRHDTAKNAISNVR